MKGDITMNYEEKQEEIIEMIKKITNEEVLKLLFEFVKAGLKEERAS